MTVTLPNDLEEYVKSKVQSGAYQSIMDVIRADLYLLEEEEAVRQIRLNRQRKDVAVGVEQSDRGEVALLDIEDVIVRSEQVENG